MNGWSSIIEPSASLAAEGSKSCLLSQERLAVGALVHSRIGLMGAYEDLVQRAVVAITAVMTALGNGAGNGLIGMISVHIVSSFRVLQI